MNAQQILELLEESKGMYLRDFEPEDREIVKKLKEAGQVEFDWGCVSGKCIVRLAKRKNIFSKN